MALFDEIMGSLEHRTGSDTSARNGKLFHLHERPGAGKSYPHSLLRDIVECKVLSMQINAISDTVA